MYLRKKVVAILICLHFFDEILSQNSSENFLTETEIHEIDTWSSASSMMDRKILRAMPGPELETID
jgi:hypothetical protein